MIFTVLTIKTRGLDPMNYDNFLLKYNDFLKILTTMIGKETRKIILWNHRIISCQICEYHLAKETQIPDHDCPKNWSGSSKAIESDMAVSMSHFLKDEGYEIKGMLLDFLEDEGYEIKGMLLDLQVLYIL